MLPRVASLHCFPVKSCAGVELAEAEIDTYGIRYDRAFMLVDPDGRFVTQRQEPRLARVRPHFGVGSDAGKLVLACEDAAALALPLDDCSGPLREVEVWRHRGPAIDQGELAAAWFEALLGRPLRLVRMPADHRRRVNPERYPGEAHTTFSDGYPLLAVAQASLDDLNARLDEAVPMERFRPNVVIAGCDAYAEDTWLQVRIGAVAFAGVKDCARCGVPSVDQATGRLTGKEPLRTLARYRRRGGEAMFGRNWVHQGAGTIRVGDPVEVLKATAATAFDVAG